MKMTEETKLEIFKEMVDASELGKFIIDPENNFWYTNPAFCKMVGTDCKNLIGKSLMIVIPNDVKKYHDELVDHYKNFSGVRRIKGERKLTMKQAHGRNKEIPVDIRLIPLAEGYTGGMVIPREEKPEIKADGKGKEADALQEIQREIRRGLSYEVFEKLEKEVHELNDEDLTMEVAMLSSRFSKVERQKRKDTIEDRDYDKETNRITKALLSLAAEVKSMKR